MTKAEPRVCVNEAKDFLNDVRDIVSLHPLQVNPHVLSLAFNRIRLNTYNEFSLELCVLAASHSR